MLLLRIFPQRIIFPPFSEVIQVEWVKIWQRNVASGISFMFGHKLSVFVKRSLKQNLCHKCKPMTYSGVTGG